ncbi:MAG: F0F1 ATP synthase subunit A [Culturomica sp.]|jgi:F-type H+-transporting ATPase subunit a|nr:F0F1 ATP synthase subunit A [Culturomica sp.]
MKRTVLTVIVLLISLFAQATGEGEKGMIYNPGKTIFEHLEDEYGWTVVMPKGRSFYLPLPVIVVSDEGEWSCFSSSHLRGGKEYKGYRVATDGEYSSKIVATDASGNVYRPWDISITKDVLAIMIAMLLVVLSMGALVRWYNRNPLKAPRRLLGLLESIIEMIYTEGIQPILKNRSHFYAPYLMTAFFFILYSNLMGLMVLFPAGANVTGNINVTFFLALCTFIIVNVSANKKYWKDIFAPKVPILLKFPFPVMQLVEFIGIFTKPIALMVRLFANMMSGHLIVLVLISLIFVLASFGPVVLGTSTILAVVLTVFMNFIDILISFIQAYVFMILSTIFIGLAVETDEN